MVEVTAFKGSGERIKQLREQSGRTPAEMARVNIMFKASRLSVKIDRNKI